MVSIVVREHQDTGWYKEGLGKYNGEKWGIWKYYTGYI